MRLVLFSGASFPGDFLLADARRVQRGGGSVGSLASPPIQILQALSGDFHAVVVADLAGNLQMTLLDERELIDLMTDNPDFLTTVKGRHGTVGRNCLKSTH